MISVPVSAFPFVPGRDRQHLARRDRELERFRIQRVSLPRMLDQHAEHGRHGEEHRRPVLRDGLGDQRRRGALGKEDGCRAAAERNGEAVAEAVGEEKARHGEQAVVGPEAVDLLRHVLHRAGHVAVQVHGALGLSRAARGVEDQAGRVAVERSRRRRLCLLEKIMHHHARSLAGLRIGGMLWRDDDQLRAAVLENVGEALGRQRGAAGRRNGAEAHDAEEGDHHLRRVAHHQRHAVARAHALRHERAAAARDALLELAVGDLALLEIYCSPPRVAGSMLGDVID